MTLTFTPHGSEILPGDLYANPHRSGKISAGEDPGGCPWYDVGQIQWSIRGMLQGSIQGVSMVCFTGGGEGGQVECPWYVSCRGRSTEGGGRGVHGVLEGSQKICINMI